MFRVNEPDMSFCKTRYYAVVGIRDGKPTDNDRNFFAVYVLIQNLPCAFFFDNRMKAEFPECAREFSLARAGCKGCFAQHVSLFLRFPNAIICQDASKHRRSAKCLLLSVDRNFEHVCLRKKRVSALFFFFNSY